MHTVQRSLIISLLFVVTPLTASAQWVQTNGPEGGYFRELIFFGDELLALGDDLYFSTDGGLSWTMRSVMPLELAQRAFVDSSRLFLMGRFGVFVSTDGGQTWSDRSAGLPAQANTLSMARLDESLFLGAQVYIDIDPYTYGAMYRSSDNGSSWTEVPLPLLTDDLAINSILSLDSVLIAGGQKGMYRSTDGGSSWTAVIDTTGADDLILHDGVVFAGSNYRPLRSTDVGGTWTVANGGLPGNFFTTRFSETGSVVYCVDYFRGVYRSSDMGDSWENSTDGLIDPHSLRPLASRDSLVFVSNYNYGVFRSTNYGSTWNEANTGIVSTAIHALYAEENLMLAGTTFPSSSWGRLFRSTDGGSTWPPTGTVTGTYKRCFLRVGDSIFAGTSGGVELSTDEGSTWAPAGTGLPNEEFRALAMMNGTLFTGSFYGSGVYRSTNNGSTWSAANNGIPLYADVRALLVTGTGGGQMIFVGTDAGVYQSTDGGDNWTPRNTGLTNTTVRALASVGSGAYLYAGTAGGVYRSTNGALSWTPVSTGLTDQSVKALLPLPAALGSEPALLAVTGDGVSRTSNQGAAWVSINAGLEENIVTSIAADSTSVYVGTVRGVWRRPLSEVVTSVAAGEEAIPRDLSLEQNYPNPFNPTTTLEFTIPSAGRVRLTVYNVLGQEVSVLFDGNALPGQVYRTTFDAAKLPSGVYLSRIEFGGQQVIRKMILMK